MPGCARAWYSSTRWIASRLPSGVAEKAGHRVLLLAGQPAEDGLQVELARAQAGLQLAPVQGGRNGGAGHGPQDVGRHGVLAPGVLHDVDVDLLAPFRLAPLGRRL